MKKLIALITAFVLLVGVFQIPGTAFAEDKAALTLKQAIEIAKTTLGIKTEGFEFNSSYAENQNGYNIWSLNWSNNKTTNESINVSLDADSGKILTLNWWTPYEQPKSRVPKHTKAEALKAAQDIAAKFQMDKFKQTRLSEDSNDIYYNKYSDTYHFNFVRVYDGIDVPSNNIIVELDKNTLKVRTFSVNWDKASLPSKASAFNLDKAKQIFKDKIGLELTYNLIYNNSNNEPSVVLAYTLKDRSLPIDAISGELLNSLIIRPLFDEAKSMNTAAPTANVVITPEEQAELEKTSSYITKEDAEQAARQYVTIGDNMKLERTSLYPGYNKQNASWNLEWRYSKPEDNAYRYISVQVDAVTKEVKSFNISDSNYDQSKDTAKIDKEQARKLAENFLNKIQPDKFKNTQYRAADDPYGFVPPNDNYYRMNFIRVENGVPCPSNSLFVAVNLTAGEIVAYNTNWMSLTFPKPDKAITLDKAYEVLFNKAKFELQYVQNYKNINDYQSREIRLAYVLENMSILIDANNSIMLNYDGKPITPVQKLQYTDIKGNKAENSINLLVEMGILVPDNAKFMPDAKMLQKDFIKLLLDSVQPEYYLGPPVKNGNPYDNYYNEAIRRKIITAAEKKPDAFVTRQDAAKMIIRAMGYGVIAEKSNMFEARFKDASKIAKAYKGYAVMSSELGIITPVKSYFYPANTITRGDAAEIIVNYLRCETSL